MGKVHQPGGRADGKEDTLHDADEGILGAEIGEKGDEGIFQKPSLGKIFKTVVAWAFAKSFGPQVVNVATCLP
jgi:hypothetical protein